MHSAPATPAVQEQSRAAATAATARRIRRGPSLREEAGPKGRGTRVPGIRKSADACIARSSCRRKPGVRVPGRSIRGGIDAIAVPRRVPRARDRRCQVICGRARRGSGPTPPSDPSDPTSIALGVAAANTTPRSKPGQRHSAHDIPLRYQPSSPPSDSRVRAHSSRIPRKARPNAASRPAATLRQLTPWRLASCSLGAGEIIVRKKAARRKEWWAGRDPEPGPTRQSTDEPLTRSRCLPDRVLPSTSARSEAQAVVIPRRNRHEAGVGRGDVALAVYAPGHDRPVGLEAQAVE